jgi:hypothetical protein
MTSLISTNASQLTAAADDLRSWYCEGSGSNS